MSIGSQYNLCVNLLTPEENSILTTVGEDLLMKPNSRQIDGSSEQDNRTTASDQGEKPIQKDSGDVVDLLKQRELNIRFTLDNPPTKLEKVRSFISIAQGVGLMSAVLIIIFLPAEASKWAKSSPFSEMFGFKIKTDAFNKISTAEGNLGQQSDELNVQLKELQDTNKKLNDELFNLKAKTNAALDEAEKIDASSSVTGKIKDIQNKANEVSETFGATKKIAETALENSKSTLQSTEQSLTEAKKILDPDNTNISQYSTEDQTQGAIDRKVGESHTNANTRAGQEI